MEIPRFAKVCGWLESFMSDMAVKLFCICQDEHKILFFCWDPAQ